MRPPIRREAKKVIRKKELYRGAVGRSDKEAPPPLLRSVCVCAQTLFLSLSKQVKEGRMTKCYEFQTELELVNATIERSLTDSLQLTFSRLWQQRKLAPLFASKISWCSSTSAK